MSKAPLRLYDPTAAQARKAPLTLYDRTAAQARADHLRVLEVQRRRAQLNLEPLRRLLGDLDLALTALARAVPDEQLCAERRREAGVCKEQLDRLWEHTLAAGRLGRVPPPRVDGPVAAPI
jgi:hypothetical protein